MTDTAYTYITTQGVIIPDTSDTQTQVENEFKQAFGSDLVTTPDTPQGVLITGEVLARDNLIKNNAALANQINPNIAGGIFLDAIGLLTGIQRNIQQPTVVSGVTVTGVAGTVIPVGAQARTAAGDLFQVTQAITIPSGGTTTGIFQSVAFGPIPCAINALDTIVTAILGWETVLNSVAGILGSTTQSDQAFRAFRLNTLAFQGIALPEAITSALYNVPGVTSLSFQENVANTTQTINGISMVSHSVYACVQGGTDTDVAAALLENKSSGAAWNGSTSINVVEPASGQTYTVKFDRPTPIEILIQVTTPNGDEAAIIQAVLDYMNGLIQITNQNGSTSTLPGFTVGADVSPFDIAGAIMAENPGIYIANLEIGLAPSGMLSTNPIPIGVNQIATTQASDISVVVP